MNTITLNNQGPPDSDFPNTYFPRLQVNKKGEIVLAISKEKTFTKGILIAKTPESKSTTPIGTKFTDWEVVGELEDYHGKVTVTLENLVKYFIK